MGSLFHSLKPAHGTRLLSLPVRSSRLEFRPLQGRLELFSRRWGHATAKLDNFRAEMLKSFSLPILTNVGKEQLDVSILTLKEDGSLQKDIGPVSKAALCEKYRLEPRDLRNLDVAIADLSPSILIREKALVYSSSLVRCIISTDHLLIFGSRESKTDKEEPSWYSDEVGAPAKIAEILKTTIGSMQVRGSSFTTAGSDHYGQAYELRALEALLILIVRGYSYVLRSLTKDAEEVTRALANDVSHELIRKLADTQARIDDFSARIQGFQDCLSGLLTKESGTELCRMYLTARKEGCARDKWDDDEVELILESVLQRADEVAEAASGLVTRLRSTDRALTLVLSATRNRLLRLEISIAILVFSISLLNCVFALFGMNLISGWEYHETAFYWVAGSTTIFSIFLARFGLRHLAKARRSHLSQGITASQNPAWKRAIP